MIAVAGGRSGCRPPKSEQETIVDVDMGVDVDADVVAAVFLNARHGRSSPVRS
jgi:hypothetical protein